MASAIRVHTPPVRCYTYVLCAGPHLVMGMTCGGGSLLSNLIWKEGGGAEVGRAPCHGSPGSRAQISLALRLDRLRRLVCPGRLVSQAVCHSHWAAGKKLALERCLGKAFQPGRPGQ